MARLSVVIVTFNSAREIAGCLRALRDAAPRLPHDIVVVDNASADDTVALLTRDWSDVRVVVNDANRGFGAASNRGIRATTGDRLLLLNPDARVTPGAID